MFRRQEDGYASPAAHMGKRLTVLVVDDSKVMRSIIRRILCAGGIEVLEAGDGRQALAVLAEHAVDCIISDWNMPRMPGIDLLRRVRGDDGLADTPFVMLTAESLAANKAEADAARVSSYLTKPFTAETLWGVLRAVLPDAVPTR
jgi:two-component system chemotaxis response regulator CheY